MQEYEVPRGGVIVGGKAMPCGSEVRTWLTHGMEFKPGRGARKRVRKPDLGVIHFTAGEETAAGLFRVLSERSLGIEFGIDQAGVIWQYCDPLKVDTFDAGSYNTRSWGVEAHSCGVIPLPKKAADRKTYAAKINGQNLTFASFYPAQTKAIIDLCDTMTLALGTPKKFPTNASVIDEVVMAKFSGIVGHYHISNIKLDPGPQIFSALSEAGYKAVSL